MSKMKIIQLSTYPIQTPSHGGQIRVDNIRKFLEAKGCQVKSISVSEPAHQHYHPNDDLIVDVSKRPQPEGLPFCTDFLTSQLCVTDEKIYGFIRQNLIEFKPDYIFLEQPWLWPAVKKVLAENSILGSAKIVYSSQNVESETKLSILKAHDFPEDKIAKVQDQIAALEEDLIKHSHEVICVTEDDASLFEKHFAGKIKICPNGVAHRALSSRAMNQVYRYVCNRRYAVFVGSAYPPNALGFWKMMGPSLAKLPPDTMIVAAGGVSSILDAYAPEEAKKYDYVNNLLLKKLGIISEELLGLCWLVPMPLFCPLLREGAPTSRQLKPSPRISPVVATPMACRGFDFAKNLAGFHVCDTSETFSEAVARVLISNNDKLEISAAEQEKRQTVFWKSCLSQLETLMHKESTVSV